VSWAGQQTSHLWLALGQHWPTKQFDSLGQQVLPQAWLPEQHWPPTQDVPLAQQTVPVEVWQTWPLSQQTLLPACAAQV
jgi:hypothetical protein